MSSLRVKGGVKLSGEITPQGAKNEALQVICATLLSDNDIIIKNILLKYRYMSKIRCGYYFYNYACRTIKKNYFFFIC